VWQPGLELDKHGWGINYKVSIDSPLGVNLLTLGNVGRINWWQRYGKVRFLSQTIAAVIDVMAYARDDVGNVRH